MKVNLSRIHSMITQTATDIRRLMDEAARPLEANGREFIIQIFETTTQADIEGFLKKLGDKKEKIYQLFAESRRHLEYSFYLREQMDAANRSSGVADKLLQMNNIKKKLGHLYRIRQIIAMSCSQGLDGLKDADYYKASFTEKQRIYDLPVRMFAEKEYDQIQTEIDDTEKQSLELSNEIAFLNQTTVINILSFEEFKKEKN